MKSKNIILIIILFLALTLSTLFQPQLKNIFLGLSKNIHFSFSSLGKNITNGFKFLFRAKNVLENNKQLEQENQTLISEIVSLKEIKKENLMLKKAMDLESEQGFKTILAKVIFCKKDEDYIVINKGKRDGLTEGMPIIISENILIGIVSKVYDNFSDVTLLTKKTSSFPVRVQGTDVIVRATGLGKSKLFIDLLPHEQEIKQDDVVITTGIDGIFPSGLLVGKIDSIQNSDLESYQTATLYFVFDVEKIEDVLVILSY